MSCHRGWCFASFLPPRLRVLLARTKNQACFHRWGYGPLTSRMNCAGVTKGPLVCAFHLRVSWMDEKENDDDDDDDDDDDRSGDGAGC